MDSPPSVSQIAGHFISIYEAFYKQVDPSSSNYIAALDAANFLKKSGLSQATLGKIWDLSDPHAKGFLDKRGLFVALKLIALVQNGKHPSLADLTAAVPPPKMGDTIDWTIKPNDRTKYDVMFDSLNPIEGVLSGNRVKPIMINSKLPVDVLTKIWDLSDIDLDGALDRDEFILAMHFIAKAHENVPIPSVLPIELTPVKSKKSFDSSLSWSAFDGTVMSSQTLASPPLASDTSLKNFNNKSALTWVVSAADKAKYDETFQILDKDFDGFVTGGDVKDTLIETRLPQNVLAHIWNLCDVKENGKLNSEQFALAMYFVDIKHQGMELPNILTPEMVPPTLRPKPIIGIDNHTLDANNALLMPTNGNANILGINSASSGNKELDGLTDELKELQIEKLRLESEVNQDEVNIKLKQSETKNLQNEIESLHQMLKQLDSQKGEARKRLDELSNQSKILEKTMHELKGEIMEQKLKVKNLSQQLEEQKLKIESQETELRVKRNELEELKSEESKLVIKLDSYKREIDSSSKNIGNAQLEISQIKTKLIELEEYERRLNDGIVDFASALTAEDIMKLSNLISRTVTPPLIETKNSSFDKGFDTDNFAPRDEFASGGEFATDPFAGEDPFKEDPFRNHDTADPFAGGIASHNEPFDPFGTGSFSNTNKSDPFGHDPFAPKPVARSESPTPALPPKKSKAPPPRPAPPKQSKAPLRAAPAPPLANSSDDPFGSGQSAFDPFVGSENVKDPFASSNSFANFANFDQCEMPPPADPYASFATIHEESRKLSNLKSINNSKSFGDDLVWAFEDSQKSDEFNRNQSKKDKINYELYLNNPKINDNLKWK